MHNNLIYSTGDKQAYSSFFLRLLKIKLKFAEMNYNRGVEGSLVPLTDPLMILMAAPAIERVTRYRQEPGLLHLYAPQRTRRSRSARLGYLGVRQADRQVTE